MVDKKLEDQIVQFVAVTGASTRDAKKFLEHFGRLDVAIDSYFNDPKALSGAASRNRGGASTAPSSSKLTALFDQYKDPDSAEITIDGTIKLCEDLEVDPEDVVMLAVAYELKSPKVGEWTKSGWVDGWKNLGVDSIAAMKPVVQRLRSQLSSDPGYFKKVYNHTFDFARSEGQRSVGLETAQAFWSLLLPHGIEGGALSHHKEDQDDRMTGTGDGFKREYVDWWFEFLNEKGGKGISKDTWQMLFDFIRTIDSQFSNYDEEAAWPSAFDEFVEYAKNRLQS